MEIQRVSQWQVQQSITSLTFQAGTSHLFTGNQAGNIHCYDFKGGVEVATLMWHKSPVVAIECCENYLYSFDKLQNLACWNINTLQIERTHSLCMEKVPSHGLSVRYNPSSSAPWTVEFAQFTPNGKHLIFGIHSHRRHTTEGLDTLYMVDTKAASLVRTFEFGLGYGTDVVHIDAIAISKDGTQLAASGLNIYFSVDPGDWTHCNELIDHWCIEDGESVCVYEYSSYLDRPSQHTRIDLTFSPDNQKILLSKGEGIFNYLSLWDVPSLQSRRLIVREDLEDLEEKTLLLTSPGIFEWSPTDDFVAFGSPDGLLRLVDIKQAAILSKRLFSQSAIGQSDQVKKVTVLFEQQFSQSAIKQLRFSQSGEYLALSSEDLMLKVCQIL